jgi:acetyltransferase-like isoleucine patch superfamily enzyme
MPGVTVGENSMVNAMSLVAMNTKIPPNEIWGGNPAVKLAEMAIPR